MSSPSALWLFAHRGLASYFHQDPKKFVEVLDGPRAGGFLEHTWKWALEASKQGSPPRPPLAYGIDRPRPGLAIVWMALDQVTKTGEPWHVRFIVRDPDPASDVPAPEGPTNAGAKGYARMFMLEHSEYATELAGGSGLQAIVCESLVDGRHRNFGVTIPPTDEKAFDQFVVETLRNEHPVVAAYQPPS